MHRFPSQAPCAFDIVEVGFPDKPLTTEASLNAFSHCHPARLFSVTLCSSPVCVHGKSALSDSLPSSVRRSGARSQARRRPAHYGGSPVRRWAVPPKARRIRAFREGNAQEGGGDEDQREEGSLTSVIVGGVSVSRRASAASRLAHAKCLSLLRARGSMLWFALYGR